MVIRSYFILVSPERHLQHSLEHAYFVPGP
jgi:hypothetical protein